MSYEGILLHNPLPSDNSCLFASISFLLNDGKYDSGILLGMRSIVASAIAEQPDFYNEAVLEKSNHDYCQWIKQETSWGGAIELAILSQHYEMEIVVIDSRGGSFTRFGEDQSYRNRIILLYDGIHYDPIYMERFDGHIIRIFPSEELSILDQARLIAKEARSSKQFTDVNSFVTECKVCGERMAGQNDVIAHAKRTRHTNFHELRSS